MELYPDFRIDRQKEQERLREPATIVFQFPVWWYGSPSLMHRYVEEVFTRGFAYGSAGRALAGKRLILSFTTGSPEADYNPQGRQGYAIKDFMPPFIAMARLCGLDYAGEVYSCGMALTDPKDAKMKEAILAGAKDHAARLCKLVQNK